MNEIVKRIEQSEVNLPQAKQEIVTAMSSDRIKDIEQTEIHRWVKRIDLEVRTILQHKGRMSETELHEFHLAIIQCLKSDFAGLTLPEIRLACQKGARGVLKTDDVHFSVRTLARWLKAYQEAKKGVILSLNSQQQLPEPKKEMTKSEKLEFLDRFYKSWLNQGDNMAGFSIAYEYAKELSLFTGRKFDYKSIESEAINKVRYSNERSTNRIARIKAKQTNDLLMQFLNGDIDRPGFLTHECQKLTIQELFRQYSEEETTPKKVA